MQRRTNGEEVDLREEGTIIITIMAVRVEVVSMPEAITAEEAEGGEEAVGE